MEKALERCQVCGKGEGEESSSWSQSCSQAAFLQPQRLISTLTKYSLTLNKLREDILRLTLFLKGTSRIDIEKILLEILC